LFQFLSSQNIPVKKNNMSNRSNSKIVRTAIRQHILDCVYDENEEQFLKYQEAAKYLYDEFIRVTNFPANIQRIRNDQARFMDYMQGLPFNFHYSVGGIEEYLETLDLNGKGNYTSEKSEILYYYLIYSELLKVVQK
jgi:hypothetical protein